MDEMKAQNHLTLHVICLWGLRGFFLLSHLLGLSKVAPIALSVLSWEGLELGGPALKLHPSPEPSLLLDHFLPCLTHQRSLGPHRSRWSHQECERKMTLLTVFALGPRVTLAWLTLHSPVSASAALPLQHRCSGLRNSVPTPRFCPHL